MSKTRIYWSENPPAPIYTRFCNILRERPGPIRVSRITTARDTFEFFIARNIMNEVIQCTNSEIGREAAARGKVLKKLTMKY